MYTDKTFLVTGGTGSFGKTVVEHLLSRNCAEVRVLSRDELKQDLMRHQIADDRVKYYIGDVRDYHSLEAVMPGVDSVFHAAALKQVPSCEFFPMQAVYTNVMGSDNVNKAAKLHGVERVVCLSTDKAVYPVNAMGQSKALMEKVSQSYARQKDSKTIYSIVRYGNVMCSRGSVIPKFIEQIKSGSPLTITEPTMTRFLMSLNEAVSLVEHAFRYASQGDIFIKKAPASSIIDLAQALLNLFNADNEISIIGIRHGEKIYETLANKEELANSEESEDYYRLLMDGRDLSYDKYFDVGTAPAAKIEDYHSSNTRQLTVAEIEALLLTLPEIQEALGESGGGR